MDAGLRRHDEFRTYDELIDWGLGPFGPGGVEGRCPSPCLQVMGFARALNPSYESLYFFREFFAGAVVAVGFGFG